MATQEERITVLEQTFATFQKENAEAIVELQKNNTILLGVLHSHGQDIKKIFQRLDFMDQGFESINQRLETVDQRLETVDQRLDRMETKFDEQTILLTQILARLPNT